MPRTARQKSSMDTYHIMLRGINKRDIFLAKDDYHKFLYYVLRAKEKHTFHVYAYCLMTNHVHILIEPESDELGDIVRRITVGYAQYYNNKYARNGHLFQNRFKSEPVEDRRAFLTVLRYIHQNPVKAGMVRHISEYPWSSYFEYIGNRGLGLINTDNAKEYFASISSFKEFIMQNHDDRVMEYSEKIKYTDETLIKVIRNFTNIDELHNLNSSARNQEIKKIKDRTGASNRQLARALNIGRSILDKVK
jgi:REP element-mobilizing transposase RayT